MIRACNANFLAGGARVEIHRPAVAGTSAWRSVLGEGRWDDEYYPWPVCWRKDGALALWIGPGGWGVMPTETCRNHTCGTWNWCYNEVAPGGGGYTFATADPDAPELPGGAHPDPRYDIALDKVDENLGHPCFLRVNGDYVLIYESHDPEDELYHTWSNWTPPPDDFPTSPTWCGHNSAAQGNADGDDFVLWHAATRPPDPCREGQIHYRLGVRCTRLLLVQNACFGADGAIDFSRAEFGTVAHDGKPNGKLRGLNRLNGKRPLFYERGAGRGRGIEVDTDDEFHFPPVDNAADPWTDDPGDYRSPVFAPFTNALGIAMPFRGYSLEHGAILDWPDKWPAYTFPAGKLNASGDGKIKARYWNSAVGVLERTQDGSPADQERPLIALETNPELAKGMFGVVEDEHTYTPFAPGTAFDMVLAVRHIHWRKYVGHLEKYEGKHGEDCYKGKWTADSHGYFNSRIAGWLYQLAPAKPAAKGA